MSALSIPALIVLTGRLYDEESLTARPSLCASLGVASMRLWRLPKYKYSMVMMIYLPVRLPQTAYAIGVHFTFRARETIRCGANADVQGASNHHHPNLAWVLAVPPPTLFFSSR
jgi:hypothetical protein